jgi:hypothetical protein
MADSLLTDLPADSSLTGTEEIYTNDGGVDKKLTTAQIRAGLAPLASPALTGTPTVPTATAGTNTTQAASTAFVRAEVAAIVASSPGALDTLDELAAALGDDANFAATMVTALAGKAPLASPALTGTPTVPTAAPGTNTTQAASAAFVAAAVTKVAINTPKIFYVATNGNNSTAEAGNPAKPYLTFQAAFNAWEAANADGQIHFGVGGFTGMNYGGSRLYSSKLMLTGEGDRLSEIEMTFSAATDEMIIYSDYSVTLNIVAYGAQGVNPGDAGSAPYAIKLFNCAVRSVVSAGGSGAAGTNGASGAPAPSGSNSSGDPGGDGGNGGDAGGGGTIRAFSCRIFESLVSSPGGAGGPGLGGNGGSGDGEGGQGSNGNNGSPGNAAPGGNIMIVDSVIGLYDPTSASISSEGGGSITLQGGTRYKSGTNFSPSADLSSSFEFYTS